MRAIILAACFATPAFAQTPQCTGLPDALAALEEKYQEQPRVSALTSGGQLMIVTASQEGGFSVLLVASGSALEVVEPEPAGVDG